MQYFFPQGLWNVEKSTVENSDRFFTFFRLLKNVEELTTSMWIKKRCGSK